MFIFLKIFKKIMKLKIKNFTMDNYLPLQFQTFTLNLSI